MKKKLFSLLLALCMVLTLLPVTASAASVVNTGLAAMTRNGHSMMTAR